MGKKEMKEYRIVIDGGMGGETTIEAPDLESAEREAERWTLGGDWDGAGERDEARVDIYEGDEEEPASTIYVPIGIIEPDEDREKYVGRDLGELRKLYRDTSDPCERWRMLHAAEIAYEREHEDDRCGACGRVGPEIITGGLDPDMRLSWPHGYDAWCRCPCGQMWGCLTF